MTEQELRDALAQMEPGPRDQMYENILKKAAAPRSGPKFAPFLTSAACLLAILATVLTLAPLRAPERQEPTQPSRGLVAVGSPLVPVEGPEALEAAGIPLRAPQEGENALYYLLPGGKARVEFTLRGAPYVYLAGPPEAGDFTFVSAPLLEDLSPGPEWELLLLEGNLWKGRVSGDGLTVYVLSYEGGCREDMEALLREVSCLLEEK